MSGEQLSKSEEDLTALSIIDAESTELADNHSIIGLRIGPYNAALYRRREQIGLTQKELAERVGHKSAGFIGRFETLRAFPDPEIAQKIAAVLGMEAEQLFPQWLQEFTRDSKQPAQIRFELTASETNQLLLNRAYEREDALIAEDPQEVVDDLKEQLDSLLEVLRKREREILILRFGLRTGREKTLEEVGEEFNISGNRVRQIEAIALRRLRNSSLVECLEGYYEKPQEASPVGESQPSIDLTSIDLSDVHNLVDAAKVAFYQGTNWKASMFLELAEKKLNDTLSTADKTISGMTEPKYSAYIDKLKEIQGFRLRIQYHKEKT